VINIQPIMIKAEPFVAIEIKLPKTNLLMISAENGYVMCGALDIQLLRDKLAHRQIIAARAIGVKTIEELLTGRVESCTQAAEHIGVYQGMPIAEALLLIKNFHD
jgi:uncharacterized protein YunC (DUF1805 family)